MTDPLIFCAADTPDMDRALALAAAMQKAGCGLKLGLEFFNNHGPAGAREIRENYPETPLFLDLKFHDIPNTVAAAVYAACTLGPQFINVHASGGSAMMKAAREALEQSAARAGLPRPKLLGVTILTSLDEAGLKEIGFEQGLEQRVTQLALLSKQCGLDGVVCSAKEIALVREACGSDFITMVPGIRPDGSEAGDQKRIMTPQEALRAGATHLVIGRPITEAENPAAAKAILATIETPRSAKIAGSGA